MRCAQLREAYASLLTVYRAEVIVKVRCAGCSPALHEEVPIRIWMAGHERHLVIVIRRVGSWWRRGKAKKTSFFQMLMCYYRGEEWRGQRRGGGREKIARLKYFHCE